jgi:hypothetical protein
MSNYGGSGGSGSAAGGGAGKIQPLYGVWIHDQIKSVVDQANQRKSEVPAEQSGDVHEALKSLEHALGRLQRHAK